MSLSPPLAAPLFLSLSVCCHCLLATWGALLGRIQMQPRPRTRLAPSVSVTFMKQTHLTLLRAFQFVAASSVAAPTVATSSAADVAIVIAVAIVVAVAIVKP